MNSYCNECNHKDIPIILKEKYNNLVNVMFIECPMEDPNVVGCLNSNFKIKWQEFYEWLVEKGVLNTDEKRILERKGWKISS